MKKRQLGKTTLKISELGLGCMSLPQDTNEARRIIDRALDAGITFFDTADLYDFGKNESLLGSLLAQRRQEVVLATKVGNDFSAQDGQWTWNPSYQHIVQSAKASLQRLQTDYIDLYQLHGGTMDDPIDETIAAFEDLKKEGLIRAYGISSIRPTVIDRFTSQSDGQTVMMQYNLFDRRAEEWLPLLKERGQSLLVRGAIAKGLLTTSGMERLKAGQSFNGLTHSDLEQRLTIVQQTGMDPQSIALHYLLQSEITGSVLIGSRTEQQLIDSLKSYRQQVPEDVLKQLADTLPREQYEAHRLPPSNSFD
ncbi:MAG TPA: aldo/keto reductase [Savagea sp.]